MADLQSMTLQERMVTIINAEHSLSYGINDLSFQEACNKWLIETGTVNGVDYSGISINKYTPEEAFAIIRHKINLRSETLNELVSELGSYYPIHKYTATEALNKKNAVLAPYSLTFDGVNDFVSCGTDSDFAFGNNNFTMSAWINITALGAPYNYVMSVGMSSTGEQCGVGVTTNSKLFCSAFASPIVVTASSVSTGVWMHLVMVYTGGDTDEAAFYINGSLIETESIALNVTTGKIRIGVNVAEAGFWDGKIDEVSIFSKALTQAEITSLYAADPQNAGDAVGITNLVGYWKFDEGTGEPQDTSGNGNHGTITSATWTVH